MEHHHVDDIHMMRVPAGEYIERRAESLFKEIMAENSPKLGKEIDSNPADLKNIKRDELKENHSKIHYNQLVKC